ncbi:Uncharacterised protein [Serratia marcescens]|nr:Uncharacterised protein [Serratia marcescens]
MTLKAGYQKCLTGVSYCFTIRTFMSVILAYGSFGKNYAQNIHILNLSIRTGWGYSSSVKKVILF